MKTTDFKPLTLQDVDWEPGLIRDIKNSDDGTGYCSTTYTQVFFDADTRECWGVFHASIGRNEWTAYDDPAIFSVGMFSGRTSRSELLRLINIALVAREAERDCFV